MLYDYGEQFHIDISKGKTPSKFVFKGKKYRISIISETIIRFEYSEDGSFNDFPTFFACNRSFGKPIIGVKEDDRILSIKTKYFIIEYEKEKPFVGTKIVPNQNLKVNLVGTEREWYFNHPEAKNYKASSYSLDDFNKDIILDKGLYSIDGFSSFDDSKTPIITNVGNIISPNYKNVDTYLFIYDKDYGHALKDYYNLTGFPPLIPRYALGAWWYKNNGYKEADFKKLVQEFKDHNIPLSVILLGDKNKVFTPNSKVSFTIDEQKIPNIKEFTDYMHKNHISIGMNIKTEGNISIKESNYNNFISMYGKDSGKEIPINAFSYKFLDSFLKTIINPLQENGIDFFWVDDNNKANKILNYTMNYYLFNNMNRYQTKRNFLFSRNNGIAAHKLGALYSGETKVSYKTLKFLPYFNSNGANIGLSWWSHDVGGYKDGLEDPELFLRNVQFGTFSPILRLSSDSGKYYKRKPWRWDAKTNSIASDYIRLRYQLIPYIYSEAKKYTQIGAPLIQPLYYKYPETYDEPLYKNEYYFGKELLVCPITVSKDDIMNRVVQKIFLPKGVWYDFKTGKKFIGGKRYTTFYKDEDYPVFATSGAIIPLAVLEEGDINNIRPPKTLQIQIFPGRSNVYKLYEDDGKSNMYKTGASFTTQIEYYYKANDFSVQITPIEGKNGVITDVRNYIIKFRNTKFTEGVQVFANEKNIPFKSEVNGNDFIVKFNSVKTSSKILVYCKGQDIEINAERVINEDVESIINDAKIDTSLKEMIDEIMFSDLNPKEKRIKIRKLKRKGLDTVFIKMFAKLLEHISEI